MNNYGFLIVASSPNFYFFFLIYLRHYFSCLWYSDNFPLLVIISIVHAKTKYIENVVT